MYRTVVFAGVALLLGACSSIPLVQKNMKETHLFESKDFTGAVFTNNIEGPAVYHDSLFVVNLAHDGTIAYVDTGGKAQVYVTLPQGSTGNCIRFDRSGNMYVADFVGHNVL